MSDNNSCIYWVLGNINFDGVTIKKTVKIDNQEINFTITNHANIIDTGQIFYDFFKKRIYHYSWDIIMHTQAPTPLESIYIHVQSHNSKLQQVIDTCLRLLYYTPTLISQPGIYIPNAGGSFHQWTGFSQKSTMGISNNVLSNQSFEKFLYYFQIVYKYHSFSREIIKTIEDVIRINDLHDELNQILLLWAFIEGTWTNNIEDSSLESSFNNMLNNFYRDDYITSTDIKNIRSKITSQNKILGVANITQLRNILAHGKHHYPNGDLNINKWTMKQSQAIFFQRDLLIEIITQSLINGIKIKADKIAQITEMLLINSSKS